MIQISSYFLLQHLLALHFWPAHILLFISAALIPSIIFRGTVKFGGNNLFSRIMLGLQLSIAIITVIAGIGFARNAEYQKNYDFGYNVENTMAVVITDTTAFAAFRDEGGKNPASHRNGRNKTSHRFWIQKCGS
jgi:chromate transport protein ChrA